MRTRTACGTLVLLLALPLFARDLPTIDEFAGGRQNPDAASMVAGRARGLARAGSAIPVEARLNVPTFVWAAADAGSSKPKGPNDPRPERKGKPAEAAARTYLGSFASLYELDGADIDGTVLVATHDTGQGPIIVKLRQQIGGIEIFREEMGIVMNRKLELVGISGYLSSASTKGARGHLNFIHDERSAALVALEDLTGAKVSPNELQRNEPRAGYETFTLAAWSSVKIERPIRLKKVYFHLQQGLEPGYYVEVVARDPVFGTIDAYAYVVSAADRHILFRNSLSAEAFTYRVWASANGFPHDSPAGNAPHPKVNPVNDGYQAPLAGQTDITLDNYPFSRNDPWLPPGSTETVGNNVDAYIDVDYPDGYSDPVPPSTPVTGDFRAQASGPNAFQYTYDAANPYHHNQLQAAITQLFVDINFLHDWFYDAGFDEAAGNAQHDNYGRGGLGGDRLHAEAYDFSGRNNANMYTPADGESPVMQMYFFDGRTSAPFFTVDSPAAAAGRRTVGTGSFGTQTFDLTREVVRPEPANACSALTNAAAVANKIVLVDREPTSGAGACTIDVKLQNIQSAGAAGIVLVNYSSWPTIPATLGGTYPWFTTPFLTISWNDADSIKTQLGLGNPVMGHMVRDAILDRDGAIDNHVVAHEWGHYLSNRLIGNGGGLTANQSRGMGEGWSDFLALLLTVRADDVLTPSNATWNGIYPVGTFTQSGGADGGTNAGYYFGVRRYPYSTDFTKNGLTFKHIANGTPLPAGVPVQANTLPNAQVHNTGTVWATMLWECYAALLRDTQGASPRLTFAQAQQRMKEYLVAGLKLTPVNPTFVEARDALLAAAAAQDVQDYARIAQAFAVRGLGIGATAPDRYSTTNSPVTESFVTGGDAILTAWSMNDTGGSCDGDGVLDRGESGQLSITVKNTGTASLDGMTGTIASLTAGVTLPGGGAISLPDLDEFESVTVNVPVAMAANVAAVTNAQFSVQFSHASLVTNPLTRTFSARGNYDVMPAISATETADAPGPWTISSAGPALAAPWRRVVNGASSVYHVDGSGWVTDEMLVSPPMTVSPAGSLKIELDHLFSFESYYDGGVIEMSRNGGAWTDIGGGLYNGWIAYGYDNPLAGRYALTSFGGPIHATLTPAVAPGDLVQVRFRAGTDSIVGTYGWDMDNITFGGVLETPFNTVVADSGCTKETVTVLTSSINPTKAGVDATLTARVISPIPPAGTVTFFDGASPIATVPLSGNSAALTPALSVGTHNMTAHYNGAAGTQASTSAVLAQVVDDCQSAPQITAQPPAGSIPSGNSFLLSVQATGAVTYQWYQGIAPNTANPIGTGATLEVKPTIDTDYWVRVTNGCGKSDSNTVRVTIVQPTRFWAITPCRGYDSRQFSATLPGLGTREVYLGYNCYIPYDAKALAVNVTAIAPADAGFLTLFAPGTARPGTSTINYRPGKTRANSAIIGTAYPNISGYYLSVYNGASAPVHFIIDITGYFR